ncbi:multiheme c-type cytochrome [Capnocytophaga canimorsus]|uniref:multiheme c-type cytochrome n=1 Tax=Capnocytophaga canimorsus TaxID=28188 RepID=UPI003850FD53
MQKKYLYIIIPLVIILIGVGFFFYLPKTSENGYTNIVSSENQHSEPISPETCRDCHQKEYTDWQSSHHFKAMEIATQETVLGDFNNTTYTADGVTSHFYKKGDKFYITTTGSDGKPHDFEVRYTFGFYPLQQYLVAFEGGRLQVTRQSWDSRKQRWFHQYEKQHIPHDDWLHWTGNAQNWNLMCASCHSTHLKKNYNPTDDTYQTTYTHLTVSCESCHGNTQKHLQAVKDKNYVKGSDSLWNISEQNTEILRCAPCHSRRGEIGGEFIDSNSFLDNYLPEIPSTPNYYADGQVLEENYKYASFLQSKMYQHGVRCSNCHDPHTTKLKAQGNQLCSQCHDTEKYNHQTHTFHQPQSEGSLCVKCHMPTKTYMGNDIRHDHVFRIPRPDLSAKYNVPNACNECHSDKSAQWANTHAKKWYGNLNKNNHFDEDLILGSSSKNPNRIENLKRLLASEDYPEIIKATALHYTSEILTQTSIELLKSHLNHNNEQIRYQAVRGLNNFPITYYETEILPLLKDKIRAVRIATADLCLNHYGLQTALTKNGFQKAFNELESFILHQSDFASGSAIAGDFYAKTEQHQKALKFYQRALHKDKTLNYVRLNLATLLNGQKRNSEALKMLQEAASYEPKNAQIVFRLALLTYEMEQPELSLKYFEKTIQLEDKNPRVYYNYGLLLQEMGKVKQAENIFLKGLQQWADHKDLRYALYTLYAQQGQFEKAKKYQ